MRDFQSCVAHSIRVSRLSEDTILRTTINSNFEVKLK